MYCFESQHLEKVNKYKSRDCDRDREGTGLGSVRSCERGGPREEEASLTFKLKGEEAEASSAGRRWEER